MSTAETELKLAHLADEVAAEHGFGDDALAPLVQRIIDSPELHEQSLRAAAKDALHGARWRARQQARKGAVFQHKTYSPHFQSSIERACKTLLDWPLMDGTPLGKATRDQILRDADRYSALAGANARNARFLAGVARRLDGTQTAEQVWGAAALDAAYRAAVAGEVDVDPTTGTGDDTPE